MTRNMRTFLARPLPLQLQLGADPRPASLRASHHNRVDVDKSHNTTPPPLWDRPRPHSTLTFRSEPAGSEDKQPEPAAAQEPGAAMDVEDPAAAAAAAEPVGDISGAEDGGEGDAAKGSDSDSDDDDFEVFVPQKG